MNPLQVMIINKLILDFDDIIIGRSSRSRLFFSDQIVLFNFVFLNICETTTDYTNVKLQVKIYSLPRKKKKKTFEMQ